MIIARRSPFTGETNTMDLPVTDEQMAIWNRPDAPHIQDVFPQLNADEREFILTGLTPEDWELLGPEE